MTWYVRLRFWWQGVARHIHFGPYTREVANRELLGYANGFVHGITRVFPYSGLVVPESDVPVDEREETA